MKQKTIQKNESNSSAILTNPDDEDYKACPYCEQNEIPFKKGICICGNQVGDIRYVDDTKLFVKSNYYSYVKPLRTEKLGIKELMDN